MTFATFTATRSPASRTPRCRRNMDFGTRVDTRNSLLILGRFFEQGGGWLDTANSYAYWQNRGSRTVGESQNTRCAGGNSP